MTEEQFDVFDEHGQRIGSAPRSRVHAEGLWHRSVNVFLFNDAGELLIQRRADHKDVCPGRWDLSVAEHLKAGETYEEGAHRGLLEELGISGVALRPVSGVQAYCLDLPEIGIFDHELKQSFRGTWQGSLAPDPSEVADTRFVSMTALKAWVEKTPHTFTPWLLKDLAQTGI